MFSTPASLIATKMAMSALLSAFIFWLQLSLGSLGILLIHDITGGSWGDLTRKFLRFALPTFYVLAAWFVLIGLGSSILYPLAPRANSSASVLFFIARGLIAFAIWIIIARGFEKRLRAGLPTKAWSGASLLVLLFSVTFSSMDWLMALDPTMASTGFGVIFIAGALCAGFALITFLSVLEGEQLIQASLQTAAKKNLFIDLGNLVLMAIMFWAYVDFMQYLIIWSGQLPKETHWYSERATGGWSLVIAAAAILNFAFPMGSLLFRRLKRTPRFMLVLAVAVLVGRWLESLIWVAPTVKMTALVAIAIGVIAWLAVGIPWIMAFRFTPRGAPA